MEYELEVTDVSIVVDPEVTTNDGFEDHASASKCM